MRRIATVRALLLRVLIPAGLALLALAGVRAAEGVGKDGPSIPSGLIDFTHTPEFGRLYLRSFAVVLSDSQRACYLSLRAEEQDAWRRRFWAEADPTPGTGRNEFLEEHLRRLQYVCDHFRDPDADLWDARGEIALRYGVPPVRTPIPADFSLAYGARGLIPPQEAWSYPGMGIVFQFVDTNLDGNYDLGADTKMLSARGRPTPVANGPPDPRLQDVPVRTDMEAAQGAYRLASAVAEGRRAARDVPVSYAYAPPAEPLALFYEAVVAKGRDGRADLAVNFQLRACDLEDAEGDAPRRAARLEKRIRVMTEGYELVEESGRAVTIALGEAGESGSPFLTDEWRLDASPGTYIVGISVTDTLTGRSGHGRCRVTVEDFWTDGLSMSDIELSRVEGSGNRFRRLGGVVVPHPARAFREGGDMIVYFELYGLERDRDGGARFTVRTEIAGEGRKVDQSWLSTFLERIFPDERPSVATQVVSTGDVPDTPYSFVLSLEGFDEDNYELSIAVRDVNARRAVTRSARFTVLDNESWAKIAGSSP